MQKSTLVETRLTKSHYQIEGPERAPVVLLGHGLAANLTMWDRNVPELASRYRVLRYDARGHGKSPPRGPACTVADLAADVIELLDAAGIERVHFCGQSMGGLVGQYLAAEVSSRLCSVTLCNTTSRQMVPDAWQKRIDSVRHGGIDAIVEGTVARWLTSAFMARESRLTDGVRRMILETAPAGYMECANAVRDADQTRLLGAIGIPALVLTGSEDEVATPLLAGQLHAAIPGSSLKIIPYAAHMPNIEQPGAFNRLLSEFVDSVEKAREAREM